MTSRAKTIIVSAFVLCAVALLCDPLNIFALRISYWSMTSPMWQSGFVSMIDLPASTPLRDVVEKYFGGRHTVEIYEARKIWVLAPGDYWAARVTEDGKPETLLLEFHTGADPLHTGKMGYWTVKTFLN